MLTSTACAGNQEITLLHSRYENPGGTTSKIVCDDGAIELVGQSLGIENNNSFSSQLQIKLNDYFIESLVSCQHDDGMTAKLIGNYSISTIGGTHHSLCLFIILCLSLNRSPASTIRHQLGKTWSRGGYVLLESGGLQLLIHSL